MPLSILLIQHIIKTNEKSGKSNVKIYCKACVEALGKKDAEIFALSNNEEVSKQKRPASPNLSYDTASNSSKPSHKIVRSSSYGLLNDYATNVKNEHLLDIIVTTSGGKSHIWKAINISLERESYVEVIEKTKAMIDELKNMEVKVSAVVTDSAAPYAAA
ncbi:6912_t:CDS:2, partial [Scutellospora calospora]